VTSRLMEGSEAIAEAMVQAGCRFFAGYPMTPFTEVLEHMALRLPDVGGVCINAESELEAVGMAWGAAATGTRAATGSVGQGLSLMQESLSELCIARVPLVVINMARGQGDYFQATRGGGHGDYRHIVLAPADIPEAVYLAQLAFYLSDLWRNPVFLFGDYYLAHVAETVDPSPVDFGQLPSKDWAVDGSTGGTGDSKIVSPLRSTKRGGPTTQGYGDHLMGAAQHIEEMAAGVEPLVETGFTEDAELIVVAYGTPGRYVRYVVAQLRELGLPVGFVRPITLWPFPSAALASAIGPTTQAVAVYELNAGQMIEDVRLAILGRVPVRAIGGASFDGSGFGIAPDLEVDVVAGRIREVLDSMNKEHV
jgi:2-oxoglutarate/2-oxoacid ferredoxin oxidoreductase subunit alpha